MTNASVRFMHNNLIKQSYGTGAISESSEVAGFEDINVHNETRWKEWVCSGAFEVTNLNNKIYINDGTDKTVTLTNTTSTPYSAASLASHITTQLNASSSNWTCSYDAATGKFGLRRSSGTRVVRLSVSTAAAWDMLGYTGSTNFTASTSVGGTAADERRNHTSEYLNFDLLSDTPAPKALLMTGDADVDFDWRLGRIRVRAALSNGVGTHWDTAPLDVDLDVEQFGAFKFFDASFETGYRYWRIDFYDRTNPNGPQFAVNQVFLGPYFEPEDFNLDLGFGRTLVDPRTTVESDSKSRYHRQRRKYWVYDNIKLTNIEGDDRAEIERIYREVGTTTPFWIALDPDGAISSSVGEFTKYVEFDDDFSSGHILYKRFQQNMSVREMV